jgi:hypothetical protein
VIPEKRPKSVTIKRNERSRSTGTGGHVQTEWAVTMGRNMHWGHVGDLAHYAESLKQISDAAFKEGEHAE